MTADNTEGSTTASLTDDPDAGQTDQWGAPLEWNPLFDAWRKRMHFEEVLQEQLAAGTISRDEYWKKLYRSDRSDVRSTCCRKWSWAVPSADAIRYIVGLSPLVEVGAGTGYWARLIHDQGGDILAYDLHPPGQSGEDKNQFHEDAAQWFTVTKADASTAAGASPHRTLFMCWPPYAEPLAADALAAYYAAGGETVVYVGELDGCTADAAFHKMIGASVFPPYDDGFCDDDDCFCSDGLRDDVQQIFDITYTIPLPNWYGIYDNMYILTRHNNRSA